MDNANEPIKVDVCISQTLHKSTTISTTDYKVKERPDVYPNDKGNFFITSKKEYDFSESNLLKAYEDDRLTIPELLDELKCYILQDLDNGCSASKEAWLRRLLADCEGWEVDEEEVITE